MEKAILNKTGVLLDILGESNNQIDSQGNMFNFIIAGVWMLIGFTLAWVGSSIEALLCIILSLKMGDT